MDRLMARAVVLRIGAERVAIVSLDLGRPPTRTYFEHIRAQLKKQAGIGHIFLTATHTHHGPVLELENWPSKKKPYVRQLSSKIIDVVLAANKRLRPARFGITAKDIPLNRNRHSRRPNPPLDRQLTVVRLEDRQGKTIAHLVNYAAHPTMHPAKVRKFSADYPGVLYRFMESETKAPCLFLQGACGDLSTDSGRARGPDEFGKLLGREVLALSKKIRCTRGKDTTLEIKERQFRFDMRFNLSNPIIKSAFSAAFFKELVDFYEQEYRHGVRPRMTTAVFDGKIGLVGVSGEFFCDHSLRLKKRARLDHLLFLGYCNDYHQYFPTIEAVAEGGYGADMQVSPVEVGAGEQMMNRALIDLYRLRGRIAQVKIAK